MTSLPESLKGPYPVLCRGHSGGRLLCEAFILNGIAMGEVHPVRKDTEFFSAIHPAMRELILNAYRYRDIEPRERQRLQNILRQRVKDFLQTEICQPGPFGWKLGVTLFTMPMILDAFLSAKVIHLIRDGRDVMLSRLNARITDLADPLNRMMVFGEEYVDHFDGYSLNAKNTERFRNELEMRHWVTAVTYGIACRHYDDRYLEVKYEDLCRNPVREFNRICEFLNVDMLPQAEAWLSENVHTDRIGKWRSLSHEEMRKPLEIGGNLLEELGYI